MEPFVWINYTSELTNQRKVDLYIAILNFANEKLASIASSQSFKKPYAVPLCSIVLSRHQGGLRHCLLFTSVLWGSREHHLLFEPLGFSLKFWTWKLKGKWRAKPLSLQCCTVIKHVTVGLCQRGPRVTKLSPGVAVVTLGLHKDYFPQRPQGLKEQDVAKQREDPGWTFGFVIELGLVCTLRGFNIKLLHRSRLYSAAFHQCMKGLHLHTNSLCELSCLCSSPDGDMWKMEYLHLNFKFIALQGN